MFVKILCGIVGIVAIILWIYCLVEGISDMIEDSVEEEMKEKKWKEDVLEELKKRG